MFVYAVPGFFLSWPWNSQEGIYGTFTLGLSPAIRSCLTEGIYGSPHCPKVSAFSQIMEALKKLLYICGISNAFVLQWSLYQPWGSEWVPTLAAREALPPLSVCGSLLPGLFQNVRLRRVSSQHLLLCSGPAACYFFPSPLLSEIVYNAGEFSAVS